MKLRLELKDTKVELENFQITNDTSNNSLKERL